MTETKEVQIYGEFEAKISEVKEACNFLPNTTTDDGYDKSKRVSLDVGKILTAVEKKRKEEKSESLERGRLIDSQAKSIVGRLEEFQLPHKEAYKELDNLKKEREAQRKADLEERVRVIRELPEAMADSDSEGVKMALESLQVEECLDFYEFTQVALLARNASKDALGFMFADKLQYEKEQKELVELRKKQAEQEQKDRDERIAKEAREAAEKQAAEAKEAEMKAIAGAALAVKQREESEAAAKLAAKVAEESRRVDYHERMVKHIEDCGNGLIGGSPQPYGILFYELEEKIVIDDSFEEFQEKAIEARDQALSKLKASQERDAQRNKESEELEKHRKKQAEADAEAERQIKIQTSKKHIGKIRGAAKESIMKLGISEDKAKELVLAIHNKEIANVSISY